VECMSLMGVIKNAPWAPSSAGVTAYVVPNDVRLVEGQRRDGSTYRTGVLKVAPNRNMTGPIFEQTTTAYDTRFGAMQIRSGPYGGVTGIIDVEDGILTVSATPADPELEDMTANGFNLMFNDGYYRAYDTSRGDNLDIALTQGSRSWLTAMRDQNNNSPVNLEIDPAFTAQIAFSAAQFQPAIVDLIFGTFNADYTGGSGVRSWGMSAWLPFPSADIADIIDLGSLDNAFNAAQMSTDIPLCQMYNPMTSASEPNTFILPVKPDGPKTIGEVLDNIMKNLGLFMVYDRGRISFGRWASAEGWPTLVNDGDFAEPKIALTFDRANSVQSVTVEYPATITADKLAVTKNPIANVERIINGAGKIVTVGSMMQQGADYQIGTIRSFAFRNGTDLVTRYSQAAGIIEVTLRDSEVDLAVGEYVSFSSAFIPNGAGSMGVVNATGIVLKAVRSWQTPTSSYTLFLPGYLYAANRISQVSVSGRVILVPSTQVVKIEVDSFTDINSLLNAPKSDPEAFDQTLQRIQSVPKYYSCALYDEYGTPYGITAKLIGVNFPDELEFDSADFDVAVGGDIIVMEFANNAFGTYPEDLEYCWDAYQADGTGQVNADVDFAYPWSR
jgi:hypothetical protein